MSGVRGKVLEIDFRTACEDSPNSSIDVLDDATNAARILVTQDQRTTPNRFEDFTRVSPGVLIISQGSNIEQAIDELILIWKAFEDWELVDLILYL